MGSIGASGAQPPAPALGFGALGMGAGERQGGFISGRHLRLKKFAGEQSQGDDWAWAFKNILTGQNATIANGMADAETAPEVDEDM